MARNNRVKNHYFWIGVFIVLMSVFAGIIYYSAIKVDYVWRWHRIPQYFVYDSTEEIKAEISGIAENIVIENEKPTIIIKNEDGTKEKYILSKEDIRVSEGDFIYSGDILSTYKETKVGILIQGLWLTLKVSIISIVFGIIIGLIGGLARLSSNPAIKLTAITYIEIIRGSPLLVQIFIWYFVAGTLINSSLMQLNLPALPPLFYGAASLACFTGAYVAEIVRAGIQSVSRGQTEAARSLGMNSMQSMRHIILPQALRRIAPPLAGQFISLIKDSSLLGLISIRELTKATREVVTTTLQPFELWIMCAVLYLVLTISLSMLIQYLERKYFVND